MVNRGRFAVVIPGLLALLEGGGAFGYWPAGSGPLGRFEMGIGDGQGLQLRPHQHSNDVGVIKPTAFACAHWQWHSGLNSALSRVVNKYRD
jgi:hypothetical protein